MRHGWILSRRAALCFALVFFALVPMWARAQDCGTWLPGPISPDLPMGANVRTLAAAGGSLYALAATSSGDRVWRLSGGQWSELPWDASMGNPVVLSTDAGSPAVLAIRLISDSGFPEASRLFEYAIYTFADASWTRVADMDVALTYPGGIGGTSNQTLAFDDMTFFNGRWYLAGRFGSSSGVGASSTGVLYRTDGAAISYFGGTNSAGCTLVCLNLPRLLALQVVGGNLFIGGRFDAMVINGGSTVTASNLIRFDGSTLQPLPTSPNNVVTGMFVENTVVAFPNLVIWGEFTQVGSTTYNRVARWNNFFGTWSGLGTGVLGNSGLGAPVAVVPIQGDQGFNDIDYVAVGVSQAGGAPVGGLARWTGSAWQNYGGTGVNALQGAFATAINFQGVTVGGSALSVNGQARYGVSRWTGSEWTYAATQGTNGASRVVTRHNNETYVGGDFTRIDSVNANRIARRVGATFAPLGSGMNGPVLAMTSFNGELIAGGSFSSAGGVVAHNVAAWNGTGWRALGAGLDEGVYGFTIWNGQLIAVGAFQNSDQVPVPAVARWTGTEWEAVDDGFGNTEIFAAAVFANTLYIGGDGGVWRFVGGQFAFIGNTGPGDVRTLFPVAGSLYAGGNFTQIGTPAQPLRRIARFDGTQWRSVGPNLVSDFGFGTVNSISGNAASLLVTGDFSVATPTGQAVNTARFDGVTWSQLPVGPVNGPVLSGAVVGAGAVVAGDFQTVGSLQAFGYAEWAAQPVFVTNPADTQVCLDVTDSVAFQVQVITGATPQYRWRRNGQNLSDNLRITGATTPNLTIAGLTPDDSGIYDCIITNCASVASAPATLTVRDAGDPICIGCPPCPADYDLDGGVTGADIAAFFADFEQGAPCADADQDGGVTGGDIAAFFVSYEAGGC